MDKCCWNCAHHAYEEYFSEEDDDYLEYETCSKGHDCMKHKEDGFDDFK